MGRQRHRRGVRDRDADASSSAWQVCTTRRSANRDAIIIDEIPYQLVQNNLIEKHRRRRPGGWPNRRHLGHQELLRQDAPHTHRRRISNAVPISTSSRSSSTSSRRCSRPYSIINIALVNRQPRTLGLKHLIQCYIDHRQEVIRRRTEHLLREAKKQAHRLEGLIYAVCDIEAVIELIRACSTREEAIEQAHGPAVPDPARPPLRAAGPRPADRACPTLDGGAALTRVQAEAIGALRLIQLVGLEIERLTADYAKLLEEIDRLRADPGRRSGDPSRSSATMPAR